MKLLTYQELSRINAEIHLLASYNEFLNPDVPDELWMLDRNLSRLQILQDRLLKSIPIRNRILKIVD